MIIPCKACGKTPKPERDNETGGWLMSCSGMGHYIGGPGDTQQSAIESWNKLNLDNNRFAPRLRLVE